MPRIIRGKLWQKLDEIDKAIERYLDWLDRADEVFEQTGTVPRKARMERTLRKLEHLQKKAARYRSIDQRMGKTGETRVSLGDPDARSMATTARMPRIVGCDVQTAVEPDPHLIITHEVTMLGVDRDALSMMAAAANDVMTTDQLTATASFRACLAYPAGQRTMAISKVRKLPQAKWQASRLSFPPPDINRGGARSV